MMDVPAPADLPPRWPRAVVFDLDGTLIDTDGAFHLAARRVLESRGRIVDDAFMTAVMGMPGRESIPKFRAHYQLEESLEQLMRIFKDAFFDALDGGVAPLMPGVREILDRLDRHRMPRCIATSSTREYVRTVFGPHGLLDRFDFLLTCEDVRQGKPHPEIYWRAAQDFGQPPEHIAIIEDSYNGIRAAKASGAACIVIPHERTPESELEGVDLVARSMTDPALWRFLGIEGEPAASVIPAN